MRRAILLLVAAEVLQVVRHCLEHLLATRGWM